MVFALVATSAQDADKWKQLTAWNPKVSEMCVQANDMTKECTRLQNTYICARGFADEVYIDSCQALCMCQEYETFGLEPYFGHFGAVHTLDKLTIMNFPDWNVNQRIQYVRDIMLTFPVNKDIKFWKGTCV
jgi:hypothetical protein